MEARLGKPWIAMRMRWVAGGWRLEDIYPSRSAWSTWTECLPPSDRHGDYHSSTGEARVRVRAPADLAVSVHVFDGP